MATNSVNEGITAPAAVDPIQLFSQYMAVTGVPTLAPASGPDPALSGKKLGVVNGSSWTSLWSTWFGQTMLPGVKIINVGNEAIQLRFMEAYHRGEPCPPQRNIDLTTQYAKDLVELVGVDAVLLSCSTMNRAVFEVRAALEPLGVPVVQIDEAMMEEAVQVPGVATPGDGKILVVATHGPTVRSTQALLRETAERLGQVVDFAGVTVEEAFHLLGEGKIAEHNAVIAAAIREAQQRERIDVVVLAQLSMSVFRFTYPDPVAEFGVPVLTSGETGFRRAGEVLRAR
jgi:aspartate/glutamate racemase